AELRHDAVLEHVACPSLSVVEVLQKEISKRRSGKIGHSRPVREPDPVAGLPQPMIQLRILIAAESLVISAYSLERGNPHQRMVPMIDPAAGGPMPVARAARSKPRCLNCRRRCLNETAA